jgi:chromosome segregation ATPase
MTILNATTETSRSVSILNSGGYSTRYADFPEAHPTENNPVTIETLLRSIDGRLQSIDGRLDTMDQRLDTMDQRLGYMDKRLDKVSEDIVELKIQTSAIGARLVVVEQRLDRVEDRFDLTEERFNRAEDRFVRQEIQQREADGKLTRIDARIDHLPTWKSVASTSLATLVSCGGLFVWLADGGAKTLAGFFD